MPIPGNKIPGDQSPPPCAHLLSCTSEEMWKISFLRFIDTHANWGQHRWPSRCAPGRDPSRWAGALAPGCHRGRASACTRTGVLA